MLTPGFRKWARIAGLLAVLAARNLQAQILPQATAQVIVESTSEAEVYLDEKAVGTVPGTGSLTIRDVSPGPHRLKVKLKGKHDFEQRLVASAGEVNHIRAVLADEVGNLEVYTVRGATVEIDGRKAGTADDTGRLLIRNLKAGRRSLRIFAEGYHERKDEVWIDSGETLTTTLDLEAAIRLEASSGALPAFTLVRTLLGFPANNVSSVAFTPDGKWVMAGNNGGGSQVLRIWETTTGREVRALYDDSSTVGSILCAPDLAWCASHHSTQGYPSLRVWDPNTGKEQRRFRNGEQGEGGRVEWISPDGKRLLVSHFSRSDAAARYTLMLDTSTWSPLFKVPHEGGAMNPNATVFVTMGEPIQFWDARTGKKVPSPISAVGADAQFSPDGRWLAVQDGNGQMQVWEVATGRMGPRLGTKDDYIYSFAFSPDGRLLVTTGREVVIRDFATTSPIQRLGFGSAVAVSQDGNWIAVGGEQTVKLWQRRAATR